MVLPLIQPKENRLFHSYRALEREVYQKNPGSVPIVLYNAFDSRTRIGPFVGPDKWMVYSGIRDVAGALYTAGFSQVRAVFGSWNPLFDFRQVKLNGQVPQILGIGSMQIHSADAYQKAAQAHDLGNKRPLIIAGGPHALYQPWKFFYADGNPNASVDIAVRGEQNVTLSLMNVLLAHKSRGGTMLEAFKEARRSGSLNQVPGLMYLAESGDHLIDTGSAPVVADFNDLPLEIVGLKLLEPKHKRPGLNPQAMPLEDLRKNAFIISTTMSRGCNLDCDFCSIRTGQQYTQRSKNPDRIVEDLLVIYNATEMKEFFGTDDNAALNPDNLQRQYEKLASSDLGKKLSMSTEVTEIGLWQAIKKDPGLPRLLRDAGIVGFWFGIEDLSQTLIKKGQSPEVTAQLFPILIRNDISPMPMLMYSDGQPLRSPKGTLTGLINQIDFLRDLGATKTMQVTYLGPIPGSAIEAGTYEKGIVMKRIGPIMLEDRHADGNHVVVTAENPLQRQKEVLEAYAHFYNFPTFLKALGKRVIHGKGGPYPEHLIQAFGLYGRLVSGRNLKPHLRALEEALRTNDVEYYSHLPTSPIPIVQSQSPKNKD